MKDTEPVACHQDAVNHAAGVWLEQMAVYPGCG